MTSLELEMASRTNDSTLLVPGAGRPRRPSTSPPVEPVHDASTVPPVDDGPLRRRGFSQLIDRCGDMTTNVTTKQKLAAAVTFIVTLVTLVTFIVTSRSSSSSSNCSHLSAVWQRPGGVSVGLTNCLTRFTAEAVHGRDPYALIDAALTSGVQRQPLQTGYAGARALDQLPWSVRLNLSDPPPGFRDSYSFAGAEWLVPHGYEQRQGEARLVFVHGGNAALSALGTYYAGFTTRLANWTRLPVFAFDYTTEPIVPWPQNLRSVLSYLEFVASNGPDGAADAGKLILVADSEGTLVLMQTVIAMYDSTLATHFGYESVLPPPRTLIGGIILSSPVVDVRCRTPSFDWNCYNFSDPRAPTPAGRGDPDTGNCSGRATRADKEDVCLSSYVTYFFGYHGMLRGAFRGKLGAATAEVKRRRRFFNLPVLSPLDYSLDGFPPMLILSGTRDYYYSDGPNLAEHACRAGVDAEAFNVHGAFHDFIEYSEGCGGRVPANEAVEGFRRIAAFTERVLQQ